MCHVGIRSEGHDVKTTLYVVKRLLCGFSSFKIWVTSLREFRVTGTNQWINGSIGHSGQ